MIDRNVVHEAIQQTATDQLEGGIVTGWVCVSEWALPDGSLALTVLHGSADGQILQSWQVNGLLHTALHDRPTERRPNVEEGDGPHG